MNIQIEHGPAYALAVCRLDAGDAIRAESGAMVSMSPGLRVETGTRAGGRGGILKGLARTLLAGESFFLNVFHADSGPGEVTLAPSNVGDVAVHPLDGELYIQSSCYLASHPDVQIDTKVAGFRNWFGGKGLFMLKASGRGPVLLSSFGALHVMDLDGPFVLDTGHVVAFEPTLDFSIRRVGSWFSTFFSGEGFVCRFEGRGRLWFQTHNPVAFGSLVGPKLPPRS